MAAHRRPEDQSRNEAHNQIDHSNMYHNEGRPVRYLQAVTRGMNHAMRWRLTNRGADLVIMMAKNQKLEQMNCSRFI